MKTYLLPILLSASTALHAVTPAQVEAIIAIESSGNPSAIGRLGERGLCQFFPAAWTDTTRWRKAHGLPAYNYSASSLDEAIARDYATSWLTLLEERLTARLARPPSIGELYAAHQLGFSGFASKGFDLRRCPQLTRIIAARLKQNPSTK